MRFKPSLLILYGSLLLVGFALPAVIVMRRQPMSWLDLVVFSSSGVALVAAAFTISLFVSRMLFPEYWWMGQVQGKDVFELEGVYFIGLRISRVPTRLQRLLFGADERLRRWNLLMGVFFMVALIPHFMGLISLYRWYDDVLPNPTRITQTLHSSFLNTLPVVKELPEGLDYSPGQFDWMDRELRLLRMQPRKSNAERFRLSQLLVLNAYTPRSRPGEPYYSSPGEEVFFNRGHGAEAVTYLNQILEQPQADRVGWQGGTLTLLGFFHYSDRNFEMALSLFKQALTSMEQSDETGIPRYQVQLLAALSASMLGQRELAASLLDSILKDERLPKQAYALALEHIGENMRLSGETEQAKALWQKSLALYKAEKDNRGIARLHLHQAALAVDQGQIKEASRELSTAASLARKLGDRFTLNMVAVVRQSFRS